MQLSPDRQKTVFELTGEESEAVRSLAADLTEAGPALIDDVSWLSACRRGSGSLPTRLRHQLREFRRDSGPSGVLLISGIPIGEDIGETPIERDSVERRATAAASALTMIVHELGEPIAFRNEKHGALVQNVVPVPGREQEQSNAGSTPLELHVENAFHPRRPDLIGLMCLRSGDHGSAGLRVASIGHALGLLDATTIELLRSPRFVTEPPPSFGLSAEDGTAPHGVLSGAPEDPDVCVDFHATSGVDTTAKEALRTLRSALDEVTETLVLEPGQLALVDNRVTLHGRTEYTPSYDGRDRWLHRCFVHFDHRLSRSLREFDSNVLR